jgi:sugar/nucleoside kinase (ribokinase family)
MHDKSPVLTVIGDLGVDLVMGPLAEWPRIGTESIMERSELRAGGSAANTALAVHYLGARSQLVSAIGKDDFGSWLAAQLRDLDVSLHTCDSPTTVTVGLLHANGERTFFTTRGHLEEFAPGHVRARLRPAPHAGAIALFSGPFLTPALRREYPQLMSELRALGYEIALDTGWPVQGWSAQLREEILDWIGHCSHVLLNELEVASLGDDTDLARAMQRIGQSLKPGASLVAKAGARGAIGVQDGASALCATREANVFDTVGAGDSFNAAYLLARMRGNDLSNALQAGCAAATAIIARFPRRSIAAGEFASLLAGNATRVQERA